MALTVTMSKLMFRTPERVWFSALPRTFSAKATAASSSEKTTVDRAGSS